jgi:hypothetical protein
LGLWVYCNKKKAHLAHRLMVTLNMENLVPRENSKHISVPLSSTRTFFNLWSCSAFRGWGIESTAMDMNVRNFSHLHFAVCYLFFSVQFAPSVVSKC